MQGEVVAVDWIHISDYHDKPLSGWIRAAGEYLYFTEGSGEDYIVHRVSAAVRLRCLLRVRAFRHLVGWHWDGRPGAVRRRGFSAADRPGWRAFYEIPKVGDDDMRAAMSAVGSTDLRTATIAKETPDAG